MTWRWRCISSRGAPTGGPTVRRQPGEPRALPARADRGHQGRRRRPLAASSCAWRRPAARATPGSPPSEGRDAIGLLAELPDLWDVNVADWSNDSVTARFADEGYQERHIGFVKSLTTKPVVGVGRFTSPDAMVSAIRRGVMDPDRRGAAVDRRSFLPAKIEAGARDEIRECIGCNICVAADNQCVPIRCTQNPTMGEEWRRGWHRCIAPAPPDGGSVLVVGGGPAGLELARALGARGMEVTRRGRHAPGRAPLLHEATLPGLASWMRVADHRIQAPEADGERRSRSTAGSRPTTCSRSVPATSMGDRRAGA